MSAPAKSVMSHHREEGRHFPFNSARLMCLNSSHSEVGAEFRGSAESTTSVRHARHCSRCKIQNPPTNRSQRKHEVSLLPLAGAPSRPTDLDPEAG